MMVSLTKYRISRDSKPCSINSFAPFTHVTLLEWLSPLGRSLSPQGSPPLGGVLVPKALPAWAEP